MAGMEQVQRTYLVGGEHVRCPEPKGNGAWREAKRYEVIAGGIAECLFVCPKGDKVLATALQQAWAEAERMRKRYGVDKPPEETDQGFDFPNV